MFRKATGGSVGLGRIAVAIRALAFLLLLPSIGQARTLTEELQELVRANPEILARRKALESSLSAVDQAFAGYLPSVDVVGEYGPAYIDSPLLRQNNQPEWSRSKTVAGLVVTQNLFDGFETPAAVRIARLSTEVADFTLVSTRQNVLFEGARAYVDVLRQSQLIALAAKNEATIRTQLDLEDERVQRGAGIAVDVLQAKSRLQISKEQRVAFEGSLAEALSRYIRIFGHPPDIAEMTEPVPPEGQVPNTLDEALRLADDENPIILSSRATVEVAAERRRLARSGYYPTFDVVASANVENDTDLVEGQRRDFSLVMRATWNLFSGFATQASVEQAGFDYRASQDNHEATKREVLEATRIAWSDLLTAISRKELLENGVSIAAEVFEARRKLREAGRETVINVLDSENELNNARINLTVAAHDVVLAKYRLLQGIGRMDEPQLGLRDD